MQKRLKYTIPGGLFLVLLLLFLHLLSPGWRGSCAGYLHLAASKLSDPLAEAHLAQREKLLVDHLFPTVPALERAARKGLLFLGSCADALFSSFTLLPSIELRALALFMQQKPYLYTRTEAQEKLSQGEKLLLLSWNICCPPGGYSITQGGVAHWRRRIDKIAEAIRGQNADVVCLYEVFDIQTARSLIRHLGSLYGHFYFHIGPAVIGFSSGLFVASKCPLNDVDFTPFASKVAGDSQYLKKGLFSFDLTFKEKNTHIITTHLNHSEYPGCPTAHETEERQMEMGMILTHIQKAASLKPKESVYLVTGDLNMDRNEMLSSPWTGFFDLERLQEKCATWGGDGFCSALLGKECSLPVTLDYTLMVKNPCVRLTVDYMGVGFQHELFLTEALSDHKALLSLIEWTASAD